jgi:hypothetical protein
MKPCTLCPAQILTSQPNNTTFWNHRLRAQEAKTHWEGASNKKSIRWMFCLRARVNDASDYQWGVRLSTEKKFASSSSYQWRQRVNMILVVIVIWRKHVQIFFILTLWRHFANMNVKNPYLVSHWVDMTISQLAVSQSETRNFLNK